MEYHLDHKVILATDHEHKNLYSWFLSEVSDKINKHVRDQIPWKWTQNFALSEMKLAIRTEVEGENDSSKINETEHIIGRLKPGYIKAGRLHQDTAYSMFGTDRPITEFNLQISQTIDEEKESCSAWGCVSYTSEIDFCTETQPDVIDFYLTVSPERFSRYAQLIRQKSITSAHFRIKNVAGFYSDWSPSISTPNIKVLTSNHKDHHVEVPVGCEIIPLRLGSVGEASLFLSTTQEFNIPPIEDFNGSEDNTPHTNSIGAPSPSDSRPFTQIADAKIIAILKSLRLAAWLVVGLLFLILIH